MQHRRPQEAGLEDGFVVPHREEVAALIRHAAKVILAMVLVLRPCEAVNGSRQITLLPDGDELPLREEDIFNVPARGPGRLGPVHPIR